MGDRRFAPPPRAYDEYLKAYSMAMLPGRERANVSYGGKGEHLDKAVGMLARSSADLCESSLRDSHHATFRSCEPE